MRALLTARVVDPAIVGLFTFVVGIFAVGRPSFWADEAATISASTRSLPDLARLVTSVDAVHGAYYVLMHGWFQVAPHTEAWSRVPSCLACAAAAAGVVVLGKSLADRPTGLASGLLFAVLPRTTWAAIEARSFAFSALAAVLLTVVLVVAVRRNSTSTWVLYGGLLFASSVLFAFLLLMVLVHCVALVALGARRGALLWFGAATATSVALSFPFIWYVSKQVGQVDWIGRLKPFSPIDLAFQYFDHSKFAAIAAVVLVVAAVCAMPRPWLHSLRTPSAAVTIAIAWMLLPTAALLVYSAVRTPVYLDKYLTFTAPAMALLLGVCVRRLSRNPLQAATIIVVFAVASLPNYLVQRSPYAKLGMDYSDVADLITARAAPGDCLLLDDTVTWQPGPIRALVESRPEAFAKLVDVGLGESGAEKGTMWSQNRPPDAVLDSLAQCRVIWTLSQRDPTLADREVGVALEPGPRFSRYPAFFRPAELGFRLVERWQFNLSQVTRAIR
jgi:mannosyltransferase